MNKGKIIIISVVIFIILIFTTLMVFVFSNEDGRTERMIGLNPTSISKFSA